MTNLRADLVEHLKAELPGYVVKSHLAVVDGVNRPTVWIYVAGVALEPSAPQSGLRVNYEIVCASPYEASEAAEDDTEDILTSVIAALFDYPGVLIDEARRDNASGTAAWTVACHGFINISLED